MSQSNNRNEPWRANERHYCPACNSWMGSDRQSILLHENGKKHRENMEANLVKRREDKQQMEKDKNDLDKSLKRMEKAAEEAMSRDIVSGAGTVKSYPSNQFSAVSDDRGVAVNNTLIPTTSGVTKKNAIESWETRKKGKEKSKVTDGEDEKKKRVKERRLGPDEGYYTVADKVYLEGEDEIKQSSS